MKRNYCFFICFLFLQTYSLAQDYKRNDRWYLGFGGPPDKHSILDFTQATATQLPSIDSSVEQQMGMFYSYTFINDTSGYLFCYSNGSIVYDRSHQPMYNGDSITPNYYNTYLCMNDGVVILPLPLNDSLYYIITYSDSMPCSYAKAQQHLYYSIINSKANNGLGAVVSKGNMVTEESSHTMGQAHLKAIRHGNGRDWWLIIKDYIGNTYYTYLFDPSGIHAMPPQSIGSPFILGDSWQACFNQQGNQLAILSAEGPVIDTALYKLSLYDFDRCTGKLSNPHQWLPLRADTIGVNITISRMYGCAFSPNGQYLYWCTNDSLHQIDLNTLQSTPIAAFDSSLVPTQWAWIAGAFSFTQMQTAPDGRIYIGTAFDRLHYIDKPNLAGTACDLHQLEIQLPGYISNIRTDANFRLGAICPLDVNEVPNVEALCAISPNPAQRQIHIQTPLHWNTNEILVYNMMGQCVSSHKERFTSPAFTYNLPSLPSGLYMIKLQSEAGQSFQSKLVIEQN